jgi:hypothetical protein
VLVLQHLGHLRQQLADVLPRRRQVGHRLARGAAGRCRSIKARLATGQGVQRELQGARQAVLGLQRGRKEEGLGGRGSYGAAG